MNQQQTTPYIPQWRGKEAQKQRSEHIKKLIKQREQENYRV
ncbi:MAG: hypothetical protein Q7S87_04895 [Agitococcus sp.]|nr:hypothetical protein [Agitococcus sp.]